MGCRSTNLTLLTMLNYLEDKIHCSKEGFVQNNGLQNTLWQKTGGEKRWRRTWVFVMSDLLHNRPRSIYQYSSIAPRLSGQNCKFFKLLLSLNSQKRLGYKENNTKYRILTRKPRSHVRILIYRTWPIAEASSISCAHYRIFLPSETFFLIHLLALECTFVNLPRCSLLLIFLPFWLCVGHFLLLELYSEVFRKISP